MAIFVFSGEVKKAQVFQGSDDLKIVGTSVFYVLIFFAIMVVILGILGAITARCYNRWCSACVKIPLLVKINIVWTLGDYSGNFSWCSCWLDIIRWCKLGPIDRLDVFGECKVGYRHCKRPCFEVRAVRK